MWPLGVHHNLFFEILQDLIREVRMWLMSFGNIGLEKVRWFFQAIRVYMYLIACVSLIFPSPESLIQKAEMTNIFTVTGTT